MNLTQINEYVIMTTEASNIVKHSTQHPQQRPIYYAAARATCLPTVSAARTSARTRPIPTDVTCSVICSSIGADFRFAVPGQSSVGLICGGRGQWLGGHHGECGARAYDGGLGAEPPAGARGRAPGQGAKPLKLKAFWSLDVQRSRQI